ncbi:ThuA domain-containing protein [Pseudoalteromonas sp. Z1A8]|uniref:ThuA domain-containing protein n=1 Tax=Pseudoalteromonas sp. Z1A8 TaxID=2686354 RepID=UPI00140C2651|nr:ThuA domain-containing protein [Pseudoalteromonas sp. Z1A8]
MFFSLPRFAYKGWLLSFFVLALSATSVQKSHATGFDTLPKKQFNVLLFTKTAGWHHKSQTEGVKALERLADKHFFNLIWHEESHYFNDDYLKNVDVVVFLSTTGDILNPKEQAALERFVKAGKGFVGIHSASDTEYDWPWYQKLVGRTFNIHPVIQTGVLSKVPNTNFIGLNHMPQEMLWTDEWYEFGPELTKLNYLLTVDEQTYNPTADWGNNKTGSGMGSFHPISWHHNYDGGRSFYTALGHTNAVYSSEFLTEHIYGGIYWAATGKGLKSSN